MYMMIQYTYQEWYALTTREMKQEIKNLKTDIHDIFNIVVGH